MKSNPLRTVLEWVLITSLLLSVFFFMRFLKQSREARGLNPQFQQAVMQMQNDRVIFNNLMVDCQEYAKNHSDLNRVLDLLKAPPASAAPPAASKTPAK